MKTVDVALSVYGKPFQTAATLATLFEHCGKHVGRVFFQEEAMQPYDANVSIMPEIFPKIDMVPYKPKIYLGIEQTEFHRLNEVDYRQSVRYQFAWENTDKEFLFITHNDCLFTADVIGEMLKRLDDLCYAGVGLVGQCWNCPAKYAQCCSGDIYQGFHPTYDEACTIVMNYPSPRTTIGQIDKKSPMPFPECRLNEFACLINLKAVRHLVVPQGTIEPFGAFGALGPFGADMGAGWFRKLTLEGFRFINHFEGVIHAPFSNNGSGHSADFNEQHYDEIELKSKSFLENSYPDVLRKMLYFS